MATEPLTDLPDEIEAPSTAQKRMRSEAIQRLQVGLSGLAAMLLLVSLANVLIERRNETEQAAVPDTAAGTPAEAARPNKDPLVDAGVVPQLPSGPVGAAGAGAAGANPPPTAPN